MSALPIISFQLGSRHRRPYHILTLILQFAKLPDLTTHKSVLQTTSDDALIEMGFVEHRERLEGAHELILTIHPLVHHSVLVIRSLDFGVNINSIE